MEKTFQELPHWTFHVNEAWVGCYRVKGNSAVTGANLEISGENPEQLLNEAKSIAEDMERRSDRKPQRPTLRYRTGEEIRKGDRVRLYGNPAQVDLLNEFSDGVLISEPAVSSRTFSWRDQLDECGLEFVSRDTDDSPSMGNHRTDDPYRLGLVRGELKIRSAGIRHWGTSVKYLPRLGDCAAVALVKIIDVQAAISPETIAASLSIIRDAFASPDAIAVLEDKEPKVTLFLLSFFERSVKDEKVVQDIAGTRQFVVQQKVK